MEESRNAETVAEGVLWRAVTKNSRKWKRLSAATKKGTRQRGVGHRVLSRSVRLSVMPRLVPSRNARMEIPASDRSPVGKFEGSRDVVSLVELEREDAGALPESESEA